MNKILLAEDDPNLGQLLQEYLTIKGFEATLAKDGDDALSKFVLTDYDLCIFDVMMPKKDGFTLAKEVRMSDKDTPIIFLTAKAMKEDTLQGFKVGADDYMTKPFSMEELLARIQAILRRSQKQATENAVKSNTFVIGAYEFDSEKQLLFHASGQQKLTSKESELLKLLCENIGKPVSRSFALKMVWGDDTYFNARSMDVYITKLRKFFKEEPTIQIINLHGEGFKLMS
ncbi:MULTISPECIES: response regulator transcription factor [Flectobacillus]|jgi:DNA-binding response OmpR family regulator|uniref:Response regulator transcription factor n=3 Tax=Bacteroidota TaxID=976 RepID=A0ABT6Z3U3_9BACT|nr:MULTISPECIES: response regulator transcription factor [Bacteroidota]NBA76176.1 response regulator [Emticicia sp. ODNR4P]MDI9866755.1 response regulator transcription factor [Flectobacillus longus]MDI9872366.1 response regulator transcription factor [Flectobacillus roseus]MDI9875319.1 response regulator transcription factor [Flectobacillus rivi]NBB27348.1 response regulator [Cellulophaga sp. BC115SP]